MFGGWSVAALLDPSVIGMLVGGSGGVGVLGFVGAKVKQLDSEVRECRQRDADVLVLIAGVRVLATKIQRDEPDCIELQMFNDLCTRRLGPPPATAGDFQSLLDRIDAADRSRGKR